MEYIDSSKTTTVMYCPDCEICCAIHTGIEHNCTLLYAIGNRVRMNTGTGKLSDEEISQYKKICKNCGGPVEIIYDGPTEMPPGFGWLHSANKILKGF
ncbi:MAG: hypothetical protein GF375_04975 [Candidatus Omnitrophica bacterium]|nr:hypothetical protein [Candidatus Omnitrophota bacterium]